MDKFKAGEGLLLYLYVTTLSAFMLLTNIFGYSNFSGFMILLPLIFPIILIAVILFSMLVIFIFSLLLSKKW